MKKIHNIVFYDFMEYGIKRVQSCIFYEDGTAENVTYEDGLKACLEVVKDNNITSKKAFQEMINSNLVHVMHMEDFINKFDTYSTKKLNESNNKSDELDNYSINEKTLVKENNALINANSNTSLVNKTTVEDRMDIVDTSEKKKEGFFSKLGKSIANSAIGRKITAIGVSAAMAFGAPLGLYSAAKKNSLVGQMVGSNIAYAQGFDEGEIDTDTDTQIISDTETVDVSVSDVSYSYDESHTSSDEFYEYSEESYEEMGGVSSYTEECTDYDTETTSVVYEGETASGNDISYTTTYVDRGYTGGYSNNGGCKKQTATREKCKCYDEKKCDYNLKELLEVTKCGFQRKVMYKLAQALRDYNIRFARCYTEEGKDVKASLTFEEMVALQIAYNNFTDDEIKAYFNGVNVKASSISEAYKDAAKQLMGAYVIEDSKNPLDMSILIESEEGKEFYHRYHKMFLSIKDAKTTDERIARIEQFYKEVRKDFNFSETKSIEGYKLAVAPMVAATLMMYQNLDISFELSETELMFLNDIGLSQYAESTFARVEKVTMNASVNKTNPTFKQYRCAIINMLKNKCSQKSECKCDCKGEKHTCGKAKKCSPVVYTYVTNNCYRNLAQLDSYQEHVQWRYTYDETHESTHHSVVNCPVVWKVAFEEAFKYTESIHEEEHTAVEKIAWTEEETKYREVIEAVEKEIPEEVKKEIDQQIEEDNKQLRDEAYKEAEITREVIQREEDKKKEEILKEIEEEDADLQVKIGEANQQIDKNHDGDPTNDKKVNESDLGHEVNFFDDYSDEFGYLDNSVENLTTDKTGDQTGVELPDPNETGRKFDEDGNKLPIDGGSEEIIDDSTVDSDYSSEDSTDWDTLVEDTTGSDYDNDGSSDQYPSEDSDFFVDVDDDYVSDSDYDSSYDEGSVQYRVSDDDVDTTDYTDYSSDDQSADTPTGYVEYVTDDDSAYIEYPTDYTPYVGNDASYEDVVDSYVESMANESSEEVDNAYGYSM